MFSKAKSKEAASPREIVETLEAEPVKRSATGKTNGRAKSSARSGVPSIISSDVVITGKMESDGEVQFDGEIDGDLHAKGLVIGEGASVRGEVVAEKVRVCGTVEGAIRAIEVELASSALVQGDIMHTSLQIESGARFEGNCRHSEEPLSDKGIKAPARSAPLPPPGQAKTDAAAEPAHVKLADAKAEDPVTEPMPPRSEPVADRTLMKRPAALNLR